MGNKNSKSSLKLQDLKLKIVLVGDAGSGKSSVVSRVTANQVKIKEGDLMFVSVQLPRLPNHITMSIIQLT